MQFDGNFAILVNIEVGKIKLLAIIETKYFLNNDQMLLYWGLMVRKMRQYGS